MCVCVFLAVRGTCGGGGDVFDSVFGGGEGEVEVGQCFRGHFPILSRDPSFQKTIETPQKTAGV